VASADISRQSRFPIPSLSLVVPEGQTGRCNFARRRCSQLHRPTLPRTSRPQSRRFVPRGAFSRPPLAAVSSCCSSSRSCYPPDSLLHRRCPAPPRLATMREVISIHIGQAGKFAGLSAELLSSHALMTQIGALWDNLWLSDGGPQLSALGRQPSRLILHGLDHSLWWQPVSDHLFSTDCLSGRSATEQQIAAVPSYWLLPDAPIQQLEELWFAVAVVRTPEALHVLAFSTAVTSTASGRHITSAAC